MARPQGAGCDLGAFELETSGQLTALGFAQVWVGLKNSDAVGLRLDLRAEVLLNGTPIGQGQLTNVASGSSGFNNAKLRTIDLELLAPVDVPADAELAIQLSVRRTCFGGGHASGTARLWFNDSQANSRFDATIDGTTSDFFLQDGFALAITRARAQRRRSTSASAPSPPAPTGRSPRSGRGASRRRNRVTGEGPSTPHLSCPGRWSPPGVREVGRPSWGVGPPPGSARDRGGGLNPAHLWPGTGAQDTGRAGTARAIQDGQGVLSPTGTAGEGLHALVRGSGLVGLGDRHAERSQAPPDADRT